MPGTGLPEPVWLCLWPGSAYLERRQAEAVGQVVCLLFRHLLLTQAQAQLLEGDYTDVAGHVVTLRVQRVGSAGVKVVNIAAFALNTRERRRALLVVPGWTKAQPCHPNPPKATPREGFAALFRAGLKALSRMGAKRLTKPHTLGQEAKPAQ